MPDTLLVAATDRESARVRKSLNLAPLPCKAPLDLFASGDGRIALLHTGVGKSNAAASLALALNAIPRPGQVLCFGCAGAYPQGGLSVGDLALVSEEIFGDEGVEAPNGFLDMEAIGLPLSPPPLRYNRFSLDPELHCAAFPLLESFVREEDCRICLGTGVTVSAGSGTDARSDALFERTRGICESMEGAALAQLCERLKLPLLQIRGISNLTGDRDLSKWDLSRGVDIAERALLHLLDQPRFRDISL